MYTHTPTYIHTITHTHTHTHTHTETHTHTPHIHILIHSFIHSYIHTNIHIHTHIHVHTHTYIYTYIHTSVHLSVRTNKVLFTQNKPSRVSVSCSSSANESVLVKSPPASRLHTPPMACTPTQPEHGETGRKEMFYLTTHSTHFIYGYMTSDIW